jgi:hypothetical protein
MVFFITTTAITSNPSKRFALIDAISRDLPGGTEKNHEKAQSG